jgi:hypothetical protein
VARASRVVNLVEVKLSGAWWIEEGMVAEFARRGSQKWLQVAINRKPELLLGALRRSGAIAQQVAVTWKSPLAEDSFQEYRDGAAMEKANLTKLRKPLASFWPARGPVWDAIGTTLDGPLFVEAKAHIPEAATPATKASPKSRDLIDESLTKARRFYASKGTADWSIHFYQYANRLAYQYFLKEMNGIKSTLVFLYFLNADDMLGPTSEEEWRGASRSIHAVLGVPADLTAHRVFDVFLDTRLLQDAV